MGLVHLFSNSGSDLVKLLESIWEISLIKPHFSGDGLEKMLQDKYFAVFFPSDKTSTVVSLKKHKHLIRVHSAQKISVKYGREWFDGNIVGSGATKSDCDTLLNNNCPSTPKKAPPGATEEDEHLRDTDVKDNNARRDLKTDLGKLDQKSAAHSKLTPEEGNFHLI